MDKNISSIIEGLENNRTNINEGSSTFSPKLDKFLEDIEKDDIKFIKSIINSIYINLGKEFNGYIEGKRPIIKEMNGYKYMTWKMQTNKSTRYQFYNLIRKYMSVVKNKPFDYTIDGTRYYGVAQSIDDAENMRPSELNSKFAPDNSIFVGVNSVDYANQKVDPSKEGDTFKFIVSIPTGSSEFNNPLVEKKGQEYIFKGKGYTVTYNVGTREFETIKGESFFNGFVTLYKSSRNSDKAFKEIYKYFTNHMSLADITEVLNKYNIKISTSWYPGLD